MYKWFPGRVDLTHMLDDWRQTASNFDPDQPIDQTWHVDGYEISVGHFEDDIRFETLVNQIFQNDIYPEEVLEGAADFTLENRLPRPGDRIIQRIRVIPGILDVIAMNIVTSVWYETNRRGFTMVTSENHYEMGEWTISAARKRSGEVAVLMHAISKPSPKTPGFAIRLARRRQLKGHQAALNHLKKSKV